MRDGYEVPAGVKLMEIDPRGRRANWTGIDNRGKTIAKAVTEAIALRGVSPVEKPESALQLAE